VIAGRLVRVTGRIERDGPITHLIAERVDDVSILLASLARPSMLMPNAAPAKSNLVGSSARHPRAQAKKLFPSRDFH
jgi:error-prone DNA polymerase